MRSLNYYLCLIAFLFLGCEDLFNSEPEPEIFVENIQSPDQIYPNAKINVVLEGDKLNELEVQKVFIGDERAYTYRHLSNNVNKKELEVTAPDQLTPGDIVDLSIHFSNGEIYQSSKTFQVAFYTQLVNAELPTELLIYEPVKLLFKNLEFVDTYEFSGIFNKYGEPINSRANERIKRTSGISGDTLTLKFIEGRYLNLKLNLFKDGTIFKSVDFGNLTVHPKYYIHKMVNWSTPYWKQVETQTFGPLDTMAVTFYTGTMNYASFNSYEVNLVDQNQIENPLERFPVIGITDEDYILRFYYIISDSLPLGDYNIKVYVRYFDSFFKPGKFDQITIE
ncbi:MAG: hypothetical protein ACNS60_02905 [Candidatus Cyclobacteriaceae bacterium M2_1C_046]